MRAKVMIPSGSAPTTQACAGECGADARGEDAVAAVKLARCLVNESHETWV